MSDSISFLPSVFHVAPGTAQAVQVTLTGPTLSGSDQNLELEFGSSDSRLTFDPASLFWHGNDVSWVPTKTVTLAATVDASMASAYNVTSVSVTTSVEAYEMAPTFAVSVVSDVPPQPPSSPAPGKPPPRSPAPTLPPPNPEAPPLPPLPQSPPPFSLPTGWRVVLAVAIPAAILALCLACILELWRRCDRPRQSWLKVYEERMAKQPEPFQSASSVESFEKFTFTI